MLPALRKKSTFPGLIDEFFSRDVFPGFLMDFEKRMATPAVNIIENKDDFRIEVAAPGLDKADFKINIENSVLTISAEKLENQENTNGTFLRKEFNFSSFSRSFTLPESMDTEKIAAKHKDGVLNVIIPKKEEAKEKPARIINIS